MIKKGILLINLGTPDSPETPDVRKYLNEFLTDARVIDIPWVLRQILVRGIISPFRAPKSGKTYKAIWTKQGSPLLLHSLALRDKVAEKMDDSYEVVLAMRYQTPSLTAALNQLKAAKVSEITILPLYPHYATSSTGSTMEKVFEILKDWEIIPSIKIIREFYQHPSFIAAWKERIQPFLNKEYDCYLFSYHGVPQRHIRKTDCLCSKQAKGQECFQTGNPCLAIQQGNHECYRAQCFATTELIVKALDLPKDKVKTTFQSRLGNDPWVQPYTEPAIVELAKSGAKNILAMSPAFVADCLETVYEIAEEYQEVFVEEGGEKITLVPSLNALPRWVDAVVELVK